MSTLGPSSPARSTVDVWKGADVNGRRRRKGPTASRPWRKRHVFCTDKRLPSVYRRLEHINPIHWITFSTPKPPFCVEDTERRCEVRVALMERGSRGRTGPEKRGGHRPLRERSARRAASGAPGPRGRGSASAGGLTRCQRQGRPFPSREARGRLEAAPGGPRGHEATLSPGLGPGRTASRPSGGPGCRGRSRTKTSSGEGEEKSGRE